MNEEAREIIDNMNEQELNDFIFFALQEVEKENQKLKIKLEKKDKIIEELEYIFYNYQLCEYELTDCNFRKCEYISDDETPPCKECIKEYFEKKVEETKKC